MIFDLGDKSKFVPYGTNGEKNCLNICKAILKKHGLNSFGSSANVYQLMIEENGELKQNGDNIHETYSQAIQCIDEHLKAGRPIIAGVNYQLGKKINEGATDHFVVIYGKGYDENLKCNYYTYYETGRTNINEGYNNHVNKFIYDPNVPALYNPQSNHTSKKRYDVTQIRPNNIL